MTELEKAKAEHRKYVSMGMNIRAALITVTGRIKELTDLYTSRAYSEEFYNALIKERQRLNIESSAMHAVIREMEGK